MVKKLFIAVLMLVASSSRAQDEDFTSLLPLKANASLNQSFMIKQQSKNAYMSGSFEYFAEKKISFRGTAFWYLDSRKDNAVFKKNIIVLAGAIYNIPIRKSNFYIGLQPGFSFIKPINPEYIGIDLPHKMMPNLGVTAGYTLYFARFCNFFLETNYIFSRYRGAPNGSLNFDEFMISGGLGFQITTKKEESKTRII